MSELECGIVGLPNVGKSTLFSALTKHEVDAANYPFCTIDPNVGVVAVPDTRLELLAQVSKSQKIVPASMRFVDIAGLVEGASQGQGLGNQFLSHIRQTDAILQVVRCFEDEDITHVCGQVDPVRDAQIIDLELILADIQMVDNALIRLQKQMRTKKECEPVVQTLQKIQAHLNQNQPVRLLDLSPEERQHLSEYPLLTAKKVLYIANVLENDLPEMENTYVAKLREYATSQNSGLLPICARFEQEIAQLSDPKEEKELLQSVGLAESGLVRLIKASFSILGLISFLTTGPQETRAWTIRRGTLAPQAAGKIHTDLEKGFIRAEVISFPAVVSSGGWSSAREKGFLRIEGKDYVVQEDDVIVFLHHK